MNRRFRANELSLNEVAANVAPFRPHVEASPGALPPCPPSGVSGENHSGSEATGSTRPVGVTKPKNGGEETPGKPGGYTPSALVAQTRMHDALHTYLTASLGYDHATVTPLFGRIAELIEHELQLARKGQADEAGR
jgi:hypothetical protein